jgi:xanthine dehydrogenase small subunit
MTARQEIEFVLNGSLVSVPPTDTHLTLLQYLRGVARLTGSKEGCGEGDCGACTLVIGELVGDEVRYRAVNACILLLAQCHGKEIISVEGVQSADGALHPVQQALVEFHGSQCGFCTPGIVMSLYAHYRNRLPDDRQSLKDTLAGNLCRCTGYGPILAAGQAMYGYETPAEMDTYSLLREIAKKQVSLEVFDPVLAQDNVLLRPETEAELQADLADYPDATLIAGGTDTGLWITKLLKRLPQIILLNGVRELDFVHEQEGDLHIGAMTSYADAIHVFAKHWPAAGEVMRRIGSTQIRNTGTIGGNIANGSPIGDMAPILIALGAKLVLASVSGLRTINVQDFFIAYGEQDLRRGEYVHSILIPKAAQELTLAAWKISKRFDQDISAVLGVFGFVRDGQKLSRLCIAFGGMAATPKRATHAEQVLNGGALTTARIEQAANALADDFQPLSDMRGSADYRLQVAQSLLYKAFADDDPVYLGKVEAGA